MSNYAVLHIEKGKGAGGGLSAHIDRTKKVENADPKITNYCIENVDGEIKSFKLKDSKKETIKRLVDKRIQEGYKGEKAIRKDAVKFLNVVLTGSHEHMKKLQNEKKLAEWISSNHKFLREKYGAENVVKFVVHLDEKTPHIHATVVPLTSDGRLSAKEVLGNKKDMRKLQDEYAEKMETFGLSRGLKGSRARHESVSEYYSRVNNSQNKNEKDIKGELLRLQEENAKFKRKSALFSDKITTGIMDKLEKYVNNDFKNHITKTVEWLENTANPNIKSVVEFFDRFHEKHKKTLEECNSPVMTNYVFRTFAFTRLVDAVHKSSKLQKEKKGEILKKMDFEFSQGGQKVSEAVIQKRKVRNETSENLKNILKKNSKLKNENSKGKNRGISM